MDVQSKVHNQQIKNPMTCSAKCILGSMFGIFVYFVPFTFMDTRSIFLDHLVTAIIQYAPGLGGGITLFMILSGSILPFYDRSWNRNSSALMMSFLKILGGLLGAMGFLNVGPSWLLRDDMLPLLLYSIAMPVALLVPLGSLFLTFITGYGLLGFLGVLLKPVMRPIWKVPGLAAVNAVASFVGSFSVGIFMADQLYREEKYTKKEVAIILTGFSTVSATFMVIIAKNLGLMNLWNTFFWTNLFVTFAVTAITARIYPLKSYPSEPVAAIDEGKENNRLKRAWMQTLLDGERMQNPVKEIRKNVRDGILMSLRFLPLILAVGTIVFILGRMTPFFDWVAYLFYPVVYLLRIPEPMMVARAVSTAGAEVLMPSLMVNGMDAPLSVRLVIGVVSVSSVLFISGTIPCILSTNLHMPIKDLFMILIERIILSLLVIGLLLPLIL